MNKKLLIGLVSIFLLVGILSGCVEEEKPAANKAPKAAFSKDVTDIYVGTTITFTDESTDEDGTIESWLWDFGDETNSTEQNPTHSYDEIDTYTVTLTVTDNDGATDQATMDIDVTYVPPMAAFTYEPMVNITVNETVTFTDNSTKGDANITAWSWDFDGDGDEDANTSEATYEFETAGDYVVTLTVTDENGMSDEESVTITVVEEETE